MIEEKPGDPAKPRADTLLDYMTGRRPPPWKKRNPNERVTICATEPEAPAPDAQEKTKETP